MQLQAASTLPYDSMQVYKRLLRLTMPFFGVLMLAIIGNIVYAGVTASFTGLLKPLLDKGFVARDMHFIHWLPAIIMGLFVTRALSNFLGNYCMAWVARKVIFEFRRLAFDHLLRAPVAFYDKHTRGELLAMIVYNAEQVASASTESLTALVQSGCTVLGLLGVMFFISWQMTLLFLVIVPLIGIVVRLSARRMRRVSGHIQESIAQVSNSAQEMLENYRVVRIFSGEEKETQRFVSALEDNSKQELKVVMTRVWSGSSVQLLAAAALAFIVYIVTAPGSAMTISAGGFTSLIAAMFAMLRPMKELTTINSKIQRGIAGAQSIFHLLDYPLERDNGTQTLTQVRGAIEFKHVNFVYPNTQQQVLSDISFSVAPKQTIALVGRSGAGKSTLVNLLPRFYELSSGEILIDDHPIGDLRLSNLRAQFALVSQHVTLFNDTIANNITYGLQEDVALSRLRKVAKQAHALDFIENLPQGFDTRVGENGLLLSGGQRQRLAIARALIKDAPILILDEATSALDNEAEYHIQQALNELMQQRTTFVIAHRLSTVENADKILVLEHGRLVEQGRHQELLQRQGHYAHLHAMQFKDEMVCT